VHDRHDKYARGAIIEAHHKHPEGRKEKSNTDTSSAMNVECRPSKVLSRSAGHRSGGCAMTVTFLSTRGNISIRSVRHRQHSALLLSERRSRLLVDW
jgi:hypothetical protein